MRFNLDVALARADKAIAIAEAVVKAIRLVKAAFY